MFNPMSTIMITWNTASPLGRVDMAALNRPWDAQRNGASGCCQVHLAQYKDKWQDVKNPVLSLPVPHKAKEFIYCLSDRWLSELQILMILTTHTHTHTHGGLATFRWAISHQVCLFCYKLVWCLWTLNVAILRINLAMLYITHCLTCAAWWWVN
jgi:hypothetical protein